MSKFGEPKSAIDNIVVSGAGSDAKEAEVRAEVSGHFAEKFSQQEIPELKGLERPPTSEELQIFEFANRATNKLLNRYGVADFGLPTANIHVVPKVKWPTFKAKFNLGEGTGAFYHPDLQAIFCEEDPARLVVLEHAIHEMIHAKAFQSQNAVYYEDADEATTEARRSGLGLRTRDGQWRFNLLDEAVTVELQKLAAEDARQDGLFAGETSALKGFLAIRPEVAKKEPYAMHLIPVKNGETKELHVELTFRPYVRPRAALNKLVDALYACNQSDFQDREEVFDLFARAALTGRLLALGRLIEKTFGPGTFRQLGKCQTEEDLEEFAKEIKV